MTVWTWFAAYLMAVTVLALVGERLLPHLTAMVAAARLGWMERGRRR